MNVSPPAQDADLSAVTTLIYEAAVDGSGWPEALSAACRLVGCRSALLAIDPPDAQMTATVFASDAELPGIHIAGLEGALQHSGPSKADIAIVAGSAPALPSTLVQNWVNPRGLGMLALAPLAIGATRGAIVFGMAAGDGEFGEDRTAMLELLLPHIRRAAAIGVQLAANRSSGARAEILLDGLASGVLILDDQLRLVHLNQAAKTFLARGDCLLTDGGILVARDAGTLQELRLAVAKCTGPGDPKPTTVAALRGPNQPVALHVVPLAVKPSTLGRAVRPCVAVFIRSAGELAGQVLEAVAELYRLTPTEATVFRHIASGMTPAAVATALGVAPSTVKSHLLRLFEKTGASRQSDLVRLARQLSLP
jgi:DNA-binding CsgD family transcriptional regulator